MLEDTLTKDLKAALLAGDKPVVSVLRGIKSAIIYEKIAKNASREQSMADSELINLLQREAKKRQESADLYQQGGNTEKAEAELHEKTIIERYLPSQLDEQSLVAIVDKVIVEMGNPSQGAMGQVIARVRTETAGAADGASIARIVRERLSR